jgi:site-specific recombinase XerD
MGPTMTKKDAFADPDGLTLQDVLGRVASAEGLNPRQKREALSALNATALWLHRTPAEIPASHEFLSRAFARLSHVAVGVSISRFRNVQSLVKLALKTSGIPTSGRSYLAPLTAAWLRLRDGLTDPYARECLGRLMRFCSAQGIEPEAVGDKTLAAFGNALLAEDMTARPERAVQSAIRIWNRMVDQVPGWPQAKLTAVRRRETYTLQEERLHPDLIADIDRYLAIQGGADPTDPRSPPRSLKPLSLRTRRYQFLQLVSAMYHQGEDINALRSVACLCQPHRVRRALHFFIVRHKQRHGDDADPATSMIGGIADMIRAAAKHYVHAPEAVVAELTRISGRLSRRRGGMSETNRRRLAQLDSPLVLRQFLLYPQTEMQKLILKQSPTRKDAVRFSVLLAIELLILSPMRIENLAGLDLDRHFVWPPRRRGDVGIAIARGEVKNTQPLEYKIPANSASALYVFLDRFRPILLTKNSSALFPGRASRPKRNDTLSKQIKKLLHAELGITWHPHLFRHLAARINLRCNPGDYEGTRRLLGHKSIETTYQVYEGMEMRPAVDRYDELIETIRSATPRGTKGRRRQTLEGTPGT